MNRLPRIGAVVASTVLAGGMVLSASPAQAQDSSTAGECTRGFAPGQHVTGNPPARGARFTIMGEKNSYRQGGGYERRVTIMFAGGVAESWYVWVGGGVAGDYDSHSRGAQLLWCEKPKKPTKPKPTTKPTSTTGSGGGGYAGGFGRGFGGGLTGNETKTGTATVRPLEQV